MYSTVAANTRRMNSGMAYWMQEDMTIPAGPHNAPTSSQQQTPPKKGRLARLRNFLRLDANTNDHSRACKCIRCLQVRGKLNIQVVQEPQPSFSPDTPRRAPTPPRRRNSSSQIHITRYTSERPITKRFQTEIGSKSLPVRPSLTPPLPGASGYIPVRGPIRRKPLPPGISVFVPTQPRGPSEPVSPISASALYTHFDSAPIGPAISSTTSEPDFDQARVNRMSTYSYLDGYNTDLSAFATTPFAETFAAAGVATPISLTRASSTAVNGPAIQGFVLRTATPVSFQKAKPVNVRGPVRNPSVSTRIGSSKLTLQIRSVHVNRPDMVRNPSINSVDCVAGSESSSSNASIAVASDTSTDNGSLGTHARILKRVLVESLEARSLIRDSFVPK
jgi:hypothetical protein